MHPCPSCGTHRRPADPTCPHCGSSLPRPGRTAAAALLGLTLACSGKDKGDDEDSGAGPASTYGVDYGAAVTSDVDTDQDSDTDSDADTDSADSGR